MALREIVTLGHPVLREKARKVVKFDDELKRLVDDMFETLRAAPGVGLAAPQINVRERVIVVELPADEEENEPARHYAVINPEIVKESSEVEEGSEGCLSIPGFVGEVDRHTMVVVRGQDVHGKQIRVRVYDYLARVFQHEIDHLNGVLFIDRVVDSSKIHRVSDDEGPHDAETTEALALAGDEPTSFPIGQPVAHSVSQS
jgi:peptide deformylase